MQADWNAAITADAGVSIEKLSQELSKLLVAAKAEHTAPENYRIWMKAEGRAAQMNDVTCGWYPIFRHPTQALGTLPFIKFKSNPAVDLTVLIEFRAQNKWPRDWLIYADRSVTNLMLAFKELLRQRGLSHMLGIPGEEEDDEDDDDDDFMSGPHGHGHGLPHGGLPGMMGAESRDQLLQHQMQVRAAAEKAAREERERAEQKKKDEQAKLDKEQADMKKFFDASLKKSVEIAKDDEEPAIDYDDDEYDLDDAGDEEEIPDDDDAGDDDEVADDE